MGKALLSSFVVCFFLSNVLSSKNKTKHTHTKTYIPIKQYEDKILHFVPQWTPLEGLPVNRSDHLSRLSVLKANISTAYIIKLIHAAAFSVCVLFSWTQSQVYLHTALSPQPWACGATWTLSGHCLFSWPNCQPQHPCTRAGQPLGTHRNPTCPGWVATCHCPGITSTMQQLVVLESDQLLWNCTLLSLLWNKAHFIIFMLTFLWFAQSLTWPPWLRLSYYPCATEKAAQGSPGGLDFCDEFLLLESTFYWTPNIIYPALLKSD